VLLHRVRVSMRAASAAAPAPWEASHLSSAYLPHSWLGKGVHRWGCMLELVCCVRRLATRLLKLGQCQALLTVVIPTGLHLTKNTKEQQGRRQSETIQVAWALGRLCCYVSSLCMVSRTPTLQTGTMHSLSMVIGNMNTHSTCLLTSTITDIVSAAARDEHT
jgi:hypothetical protein